LSIQKEFPKKKEITMGTQQILLIVLSVIIVGVAIIVGIGMFNRQAYNSNAQAIASDARNYATEVVQYWNTPMADGGAGATSDSLTAVNMTAANLAARLKIGANEAGAVSNENGKYWVSSVSAAAPYEYVISGVGKAERGGQNPKIETTVTLPAGDIVGAASEVAAP
jgi:hypothetical protein